MGWVTPGPYIPTPVPTYTTHDRIPGPDDSGSWPGGWPPDLESTVEWSESSSAATVPTLPGTYTQYDVWSSTMFHLNRNIYSSNYNFAHYKPTV